MHTQKLIVATLALVIGVGIGALLSGVISPDYGADSDYLSTEPIDATVLEFKTTIETLLEQQNGRAVAIEPLYLIRVLPSLAPRDFDGVEATVGQYVLENGKLTYTHKGIPDAAANDITDAGLKRFRDNVYRRLGITVGEVPVSEVITTLRTLPVMTTNNPSVPPSGNDTPTEPVACTMDAKQCPDGSFVGRVAPDCSFAECPGPVQAPVGTVVCTPEQKAAEACIEIYAPVCAAVQVECVTTPCNPVPQTFPNSCFACAENRVISYTEGACTGEAPTE